MRSWRFSPFWSTINAQWVRGHPPSSNTGGMPPEINRMAHRRGLDHNRASRPQKHIRIKISPASFCHQGSGIQPRQVVSWPNTALGCSTIGVAQYLLPSSSISVPSGAATPICLICSRISHWGFDGHSAPCLPAPTNKMEFQPVPLGAL